MGRIVEARCPFPSLFATRCARPRRSPSYVVLVQRSLSLRSRVVGAGGSGDGRRALDAEAERRRREIYSRAGVLEPGEAAQRDAAGSSLLVAEAFRETCRGHDGAVVLVDVAGTFSETLTDDDDDDEDEEEDSCLASWRTNGATVDLSSDPLGWNDDDDDDHVHDHDKRRPCVVSSRLDDLEAVARSIERAAEIVRDQNNLVDVAVPIFFDSFVPLVATHGIGRAADLIERLRRPRASSSSSSPRLSPVVVPVDAGAWPPAHRRRLEDLADAIATLSGGELLVVRKSRRGTSKIVKETQPFALVVSASDDRRAPRMILADLSSSTESSDGARTENAAASQISKTNTTTTTAAVSLSSYTLSPPTPVPPRRPRPKLRLEEDDDKRVTAATKPSDRAKSRPRIFLQDDDPEFDDLDEEDPDDDLDL